MLKLTPNQVAKAPLKSLNILLGSFTSHRAKAIFLSFVVRELLTFEYVESNRSPLNH